jgi:hypothetical protein
VLVPNAVVKAILLIPCKELGGSFIGYGLDNVPPEVMTRLNKFGLQKLPSDVWTKPEWTAGDEDVLVHILEELVAGHFVEPEMVEG